MIDYTPEDDASVKWCEEKYPEIATEYKKIMMEQYILFCKKHRNYGLVVLGEPDTVGESVADTLKDLSVYGIIGQIVQQGKFK